MNQNGSLFHIKPDIIDIVNGITSFFQQECIELEFQSVTSYFNHKSYTFIKNGEVGLSIIQNYANELATYLKVNSIRIIYQDKNSISFEVFNEKRKGFDFLDLIEDKTFQNPKGMILPILLGERSRAYVTDLAKMPHLLVEDGILTGNNRLIHSLILSLLYHHSSEKLKFILIGKEFELSIYNDIPHLLTPAIQDDDKVMNVLSWCVSEMERRYLLVSQAQVCNITQYNEKIDKKEYLPYIIIIIDVFADLRDSYYVKEIESYLVKLLFHAENIGIHLVVATGGPSVVRNIINETLMPSRVTFTVSSPSISLSTIFDVGGEEYLCGYGDILLSLKGHLGSLQLQAPTVSYDTVQQITDKIRLQGKPTYIEFPKIHPLKLESKVDELAKLALIYILETGNTSISNLQRIYGISFKRASHIIEYLEFKGVLSEPKKYGKREILKATLS